MKVMLKSLLIKHEGEKLKLYKDTFGNLTIGIGRNLSDREIYQNESDLMFENDVNYFSDFLSKNYPFFDHLNEARQCALIDMCFMGIKKFQTFKRMLQALTEFDYERAALEVMDSRYALQVGQRAIDISNIIRTGEL
jgi:lysozyme